jgi:hypothetical protein
MCSSKNGEVFRTEDPDDGGELLAAPGKRLVILGHHAKQKN